MGIKIIDPNLKWNGILPNGENIPVKLVLHHAEASRCTVYDIHNWHLQRGWAGIGYHYFVRKDGTIYKGRNESWRGAHCPTANYNSIGICFEGSYMIEQMPETQIYAGQLLIADIFSRYGKMPVYGHKELYSTDCPGINFSLEKFKNSINVTPSTQTDSTQNGLMYPYNAQIKGDFFYVRDKDGVKIAGRRVDDGDNITVIQVFYDSQLVLVQYPTSTGIRKGYISNSKLIKYYKTYNWQNGSTKEAVYDYPKGNIIGYLNPREKATILYKVDGWTCVVYTTNKGEFTKSGFVKFRGI